MSRNVGGILGAVRVATVAPTVLPARDGEFGRGQRRKRRPRRTVEATHYASSVESRRQLVAGEAALAMSRRDYTLRTTLPGASSAHVGTSHAANCGVASTISGTASLTGVSSTAVGAFWRLRIRVGPLAASFPV